MLGEDDSQEAIIAVAAYTNTAAELFEVAYGDVPHRLIYVLMLGNHQQTTFSPYAYVYSLRSRQVYTVSGELDPVTVMNTIATRDQ